MNMAKKKTTEINAAPAVQELEAANTVQEEGMIATVINEQIAENEGRIAESETPAALRLTSEESPGANGFTPTQQIVLEVDPDNILIDPDLRALRAWNGRSRQELALPELARTMYEMGQKEPARVFETDEGYVLYDGHRRREAVQIIREEWDATWTLRILVDNDLTKADALRSAMLADSQHEKFTPMELGRNIAFLRKQFNWEGGDKTAVVADFLGVSPATVTQMERLTDAADEVRMKVERGELTVSAALDLISVTSTVPEDERTEAQEKVAAKAKEIAERQAKKKEESKPTPKRTPLTKEQQRVAENVRRAAEEDRKKREALTHTDATPGSLHAGEHAADTSIAATDTVPPERKTPAMEKVKVTGTHVRQAARQVLGDKAKVKAPKMSEAIELIEQWAGPAYPDVMAKFAGTFADWGHGKKSDKLLEAAWDDIADELAKVPKSKSTPKSKVPTKPVTKPTPAKKAAKPSTAKPATKKAALSAAKPAVKKTAATPVKPKAK